jgi:hypothetical protein
MTARDLNPHLFVVARQEKRESDELFDASGADLVARRALIVARRMLMVVTTPLLRTFIQHLISQDDDFANHVAARLKSALKGRAPAIWMTDLTGRMATGLTEANRESVRVELAQIVNDSQSETNEHLPCVCLLLERGASRIFLPDPSQELHIGDRLLFAGRDAARREIAWSLSQPYTLITNATGRIMHRGMLFRWFSRKKN